MPRDQRKHTEVAELYDRISKDYDQANRIFSKKMLENLERFSAAMPPDAKILDIGCGNGRDMSWLEARGYRVTGVDISSGMLEIARDSVSGPLMQADLLELTLPKQSFDGIWCSASLVHMSKDEMLKAICLLAGFLMPSGLMFVSLKRGEVSGPEINGRFKLARYFYRYEDDELYALLKEMPTLNFEVTLEDRWLGVWIKHAN